MCHEPLVAQMAKNSGCADTSGRVEYIYTFEKIIFGINIHTCLPIITFGS